MREDPLYLGVNEERLRGDAYVELMDEFVTAIQDRFPGAVIQFEDFATSQAFMLLERYRDQVPCFNDDIQGTAAVALAGVLASLRVTGRALVDTTFMFLGAGSAATGIGELIVAALADAGLPHPERNVWFVDRKGLLVAGRDTVPKHAERYAHEHPAMSFSEAVRTIRPQVLIGATGHPGAFTEEVITQMGEHNIRPVIFALSNPTSRAEMTAQQAYAWTDGRAIFASGSPFPAVTLADGTRRRPGQGNNAYVFPGIGLGVLGSRARSITQNMFLAAARTLAAEVTEEDLSEGAVYPRLSQLREVSLRIAVAVAEQARLDGVATATATDTGDWSSRLEGMMYDPTY